MSLWALRRNLNHEELIRSETAPAANMQNSKYDGFVVDNTKVGVVYFRNTKNPVVFKRVGLEHIHWQKREKMKGRIV